MEELEIKRLKRNNILLIVIIFILIIVGVFGYYTYFIRNKNTSKITEENNYTKTGESSIIKNIPYWFLLDGSSKTVKDLSVLERINMAYISLDSSKIKEYSTSDKTPVKDETGVTYPIYEDKTKLDCFDRNAMFGAGNIGNLKKIYQSLHYTVSEIERADNSVWSCVWADSNSYDSYYVVKKEDIKAKLIELFGTDNNILDKSFEYNLNYDRQFYCGVGDYIYDKNVGKLIYWPNGGCTASILDKIYVLREYEKDGLTKLDVVDVHFGGYELGDYPKEIKIYNSTRFIANSKISPVSTFTIKNESEEKLIYEKVKEVKNKLENYTLTFTKVGDHYQFVSVDYKEQ